MRKKEQAHSLKGMRTQPPQPKPSKKFLTSDQTKTIEKMLKENDVITRSRANAKYNYFVGYHEVTYRTIIALTKVGLITFHSDGFDRYELNREKFKEEYPDIYESIKNNL